MAATQFLPIAELQKLQYFVRYATRSVADGVLNSTTTVTSATAAFTSADVGASISGTGIPGGATITTVNSGTSVTISAAATATNTGVTLTITQTTSNAVTSLGTALNSAFAATAGNIQTWQDTTSGQTTNCVIDSGNTSVLSVAVGNWVGWNNGGWQQYTPSQMTANFVQYFLT